MTKPQLVKVEALFYVLQQVTKRDCAYFDTAPFCIYGFRLCRYPSWFASSTKRSKNNETINMHLFKSNCFLDNKDFIDLILANKQQRQRYLAFILSVATVKDRT